MYWADKVAKEIIESGKYKPYLVDDMFTPSGFAHIGSLRGPLIHDLIYKSLLHSGQQASFTFVINDFDPIDGLPAQLEKDFSKYLGFPLKTAPSPKKGYESFADYFAAYYQAVLEKLGVKPEYYSSWQMYHQGRFDEVIKEALDNAETIRRIYREVSGSQKEEKGWLPLQVICPTCGKLGTTRTFDWNGKTVAYKCEKNLVNWAVGCESAGRVSPFGGNGKLPWKVDWPAHWKVLGVTIEGAGKDHSVAGGSRDIAKALCQEVFKIDEPYNLPYEFLTIGGKKMASSKGLGLKARDLFDLLPVEVGRFLYCRTDYRQEVNFDPNKTMAIPDLFDEYDRCYKAYVEGTDMDLSRTFEMSQIDDLPKKEPVFLPRFRDIVNFIQQVVDIKEKFEEIKGKKLTWEELKILKDREKYARTWLGKYSPDEYRLEMSKTLPHQVTELTKVQKEFLQRVAVLIEKDLGPEDLLTELYNLSRQLKLHSKDAFTAIYKAMIGKEHGPRAAWFLLSYPKEKVIQRLKEASK